MVSNRDILDTCAARVRDALPHAARRGPARDASLYLAHTEMGVGIRELADAAGTHPSTVSRAIRRVEGRRDDPLYDRLVIGGDRPRASAGEPSGDGAGDGYATGVSRSPTGPGSALPGTSPGAGDGAGDGVETGPGEAPGEAPGGGSRSGARRPPAGPHAEQPLALEALRRAAKRFLRRLSEPGAFMIIAQGTDKAGIFCSANDHRRPIAMLPVAVAVEFLRQDWIRVTSRGTASVRYRITEIGRSYLRRELSEEHEARRATGMAEAPTPFAAQHREAGERLFADPDTGASVAMQVNLGESPIGWLSKRKGPDGMPFLTPEEVDAAEKLRADFEAAQIGPSVAQDWRKFLTPADRYSGSPRPSGPAEGPAAARERVTRALGVLGPGLSDVALRACCFLEGLEGCERRLGWSARSGKVVLKLALQRLVDHYGLAPFKH